MIGVVSPHLYDVEGSLSPNLGDEIIFTYLIREIKALAPGEPVFVFPLHAKLNQYHRSLLDRSRIVFVVGSNFVAPGITQQRKGLQSLFDLGVRGKVVFMGAGWSGNAQQALDKSSIELYRSIMHESLPQSARDSVTREKLLITRREVVNTSCPTMWRLREIETNRTKVFKSCLFTLTDYQINIVEDSVLLDTLLSKFDELVFFPQGKYDLGYLQSLDVYKNNKTKFKILERSLSALDQFMTSDNFTYVGTRLHCGIHALNSGKEVLILGVDNRAKFIANDTGLPMLERDNKDGIVKWLEGEKVFGGFSLPKNWTSWKERIKI